MAPHFFFQHDSASNLAKWDSLLRWGIQGLSIKVGYFSILSGIQFTTHFIDFFVVETKQFVGSSVNVILTQQTCGQHSSRAVESKR